MKLYLFGRHENEANARLIAAAPDALAVLKEIHAAMTDDGDNAWIIANPSRYASRRKFARLCLAAESAIRKAEQEYRQKKSIDEFVARDFAESVGSVKIARIKAIRSMPELFPEIPRTGNGYPGLAECKAWVETHYPEG